MQCVLLYTSCLFSKPLNDDIVDIEKPDGIFSLNLVAHDFSGFFYIHQSFLLKIQDMRK